jgi:hypothetical protein
VAASARIRRIMSETFGGLGTPDWAGRPVQELIMAETGRERGGKESPDRRQRTLASGLGCGPPSFKLQYVPSIDPFFGEQPETFFGHP